MFSCVKVRMAALVAVAAVAVAMAPGAARAESILVNGDFETPGPTPEWIFGEFFFYLEIPGWHAAFGQIEIQKSNGIFTAQAQSGSQFVELDANNENSVMFQDIPTVANRDYILSFYYSPRNIWEDGQVFSASTNQIDLFWEGEFVKSISEDSPSTKDNLWRLEEVVVQAHSQSGFSRLQFNAAGEADGVGGLLDQVSVTQAVPEPSTLALLFLGLTGLLGYRITGKLGTVTRFRPVSAGNG